MDTAHVLPVGAQTRSGWRSSGQPLLVAGAAAAAVAVLHFRDPHGYGSYGLCPFYVLTGWWCPGCGGLRAVHNLTDGRVLDAVHSNVFVLPLLVGAVVWWASWALDRWRGRPPRPFPLALGRTGWAVVLTLLTAFTVLRNTPWGGWLAPV
ncbi:DUF2752 domain-containing protein [Nocardia transvalensis]|uniref:DUF2752 domain-containing protein n=1 Tax=Nocardia transvalensis TaxID=37333 RepID=UPI0018961EBE|nr:DUF2752 domain-containing protein [Nocardia transvalensis]MBF6333959.1 DUF2752 domain-containing protein [Nocardia transvalensis]